MTMMRACFESARTFFASGRPTAFECVVRLVDAFPPENRFFADLAIEILLGFDHDLWPHHRSPTSASRPAGRDLKALLGRLVKDSTALLGADRQSFLSNVVAHSST